MKWITWILVLAVAVGAAYYVLVLRQQEPVAAPPPAILPPAAEVPGEGQPAAEAPGAGKGEPSAGVPPEAPADPTPEPLPPLERSDPAIRDLVTGWVGESAARELLVDEALAARFVATIDNLTARKVAATLLPVQLLGDSLAVVPDPDPPAPITNAEGDLLDQYLLDAANARRYETHLGLLEGIGGEALAAAYRRYQPLLQEAYVDLGYPGADFTARFVEVIDHLLATPDVAGEIRLIKPEAYYLFADPGLEALSAGQKLLIRMGPDHAARVKALLRDLRERLARDVAEPGAPGNAADPGR